MKRFFTFLTSYVLFFSAVHAQHFVADMEVKEDTLIFKVKAVGDFEAEFYDIELYLRWSNAYNIAFTPAVTNATDFPGLTIDYIYNSPYSPDPGYNNIWMYFLPGNFTYLHHYTDGTVYELFRTVMTGDIPPSIELVADNETGMPYYFVAMSATSRECLDLTPYPPVVPFIEPTGFSGPFYYKTFAFGEGLRSKANKEMVPVSLDQRIPQPSHVNAIRNHLQNRKNRPVDPVQPATTSQLLLNIYPNPVNNSMLKMMVSTESDDKLGITLSDMTGRIMATYEQYVSSGQTQLSFQLPKVSSGYYVVQVTGRNHRRINQKIFIQ